MMRHLAAIGFLFVSVGITHADDLPREAPAAYTRELQELVTPAEDALEGAVGVEERAAREDDVAVVLYETVTSIAEDGSLVFVAHQILRATTDSGAAAISTSTFPYRRDDQTIYLPLARTIQPDMETVPVRPDGAFIQTPQHLADQSLFTDRAELSIVFPHVKAGSAVETIIITEQPSTRIPGELSSLLGFEFGWPADRLRHVLELPSSWAERLRQTPVGSTPSVARKILEGDRVRLEWVEEQRDGAAIEPNRPPIWQSGPIIWLTTLENWDAFADWYRGLLADRSELTAELAGRVDEWTDGLETPEEVVSLLHRKVADDIRYTGLEFGIASFQPKSPSEVWGNQYGDCKDKANLLRALLAHKGIRSHIALLSTTHVGTIEQSSPTYKQFNHAILAIAGEDGSYTWSDPTIPHLPAGGLGPDDAGRTALVILDDGHQFVRTPDQPAGEVDILFDLRLDADGSLAGWMQFEATGFMGAVFREYFDELAGQDLMNALQSYVSAFFEVATVVDHEFLPVQTSIDPRLRLKVYLTVPGDYRSGSSGERLRLTHGGLFPQIDPDPSRKTGFYQWVLSTRLRFRYALPEGWAVEDLPQPYDVADEIVVARGRWSATEERMVSAEISLSRKVTQVPSSRFGGFVQTIRSLASWMDRPVLAQPSDDWAAATATVQQSEVLSDAAFPPMPTAEGQMRLVESRFPADGNASLRRAALEKTLQRFPADRKLVFEARIKLVSLDCDEQVDGASMELRQLIDEFRDEVSAENIGWARYLLALCPEVDKEESIRTLLDLARDEGLPLFRRGWSYQAAAQVARSRSDDEALRILEEGSTVALGEPLLLIFTHRLWITADSDSNALEAAIQEIVTHDQAELILTYLSEAVLEAFREGDRGQATTIADATVRAVAGRPQLAAAIAEIVSIHERGASYARIAARLEEYIREHPPAWWNQIVIPSPLPEREVFVERVAVAYDEESVESYLRHVLELLIAYAWDPSFADQLGSAARVADYFYPDDDLTAELVELNLALPEGDDALLEGIVLHTDRLREQGRAEEGLALLRGTDEQTLPAAYRLTFRQRIARSLEELQRYDEALEAYERLVDERQQSVAAYDGLLRAVFLHLTVGSYDEALRLASFLGELEPADIAMCDYPPQVESLAALAAVPERAKAFWASGESWWPDWVELEGKFDLEPIGDRRFVPEIGDLEQLGTTLGIAAGSGDRLTVARILRTLMHAARWQPEIVPEMGSVSGVVNDAFPELVSETRQLVAKLCGSAELIDTEQLQKSRLLVVAFAFDDAEYARVEEEGSRYMRDFPDGDPGLRARVATLWGLAATDSGEDLDAPRSKLEEALAQRTLPDELRAWVVFALAGIYRSQEQPGKELELLEQEIGETDNTDDPRIAMLRTRLATLRGAPTSSDGFGEALARWNAVHRPAWFDYARPESLQDVPNVDAALDANDESWTDAERVKIAMLVADDPDRPHTVRAHAFSTSLRWLEDLTSLRSTRRAFLNAVAADAHFGETVRAEAVMRMLFEALEVRDAAAFRQALEHPATAGWSKEQKQQAKLLEKVIAVPMDQPEALAGFLEELLQEPLDIFEKWIFFEQFYRLLYSGGLDQAARVYDSMKQLQLDGATPSQVTETRFQFLRMLESAKQSAPALEAMRSAALAAIRPRTIESPPEIWWDLGDIDFATLLDPQEATSVLLYELISRNLPLDRLHGWPTTLVHGLDETDASVELALAVDLAGIEHAWDDLTRSRWIYGLTSVVSLHDEERWTRMGVALKPYLDQKDWPNSRSAVRILDLIKRMSRGEPIDIDAETIGLEGSITEVFASALSVDYYLARDDVESLKRKLKSVPSGRMVLAGVSRSFLAGLSRVGMNAEADLVREVVEEQLYEAVLDSWSTPSSAGVLEVLALAETLDPASPAYPDAWLAHVLDRVEDPLLAHLVRMLDAEFRQAWDDVRLHGEALLARQPFYKRLHWHLGLAAYQVGDWARARDSLAEYVATCHHETKHSRARAYLAEVEQKLQNVEAEAEESP